jgi:hypothetical protein
MMGRILLPMIFVLIVAAPVDLQAYREHGRMNDNNSMIYASPSRKHKIPRPLHERMFNPGKPGKPTHPIYPGDKPGRPGGGHWPFWRPVSTTIVREVQPVIIVNTPPTTQAEPPPEPEKVWVPAVMDTRTEPGYWDYGVKKRWMGDHWRFEQDFATRVWVPETQVKYVSQEGYWKTVE